MQINPELPDRTADSDSVNLGSNPSSPAIEKAPFDGGFSNSEPKRKRRNNANGPRTAGAQESAQSARPPKRLRILTNRNYETGFEAIEWDAAHRQFFWYAEEAGIVACFPCDQQFASEKFAECGRQLDVTKLPNWPAPPPTWVKRLLSLLKRRFFSAFAPLGAAG